MNSNGFSFSLLNSRFPPTRRRGLIQQQAFEVYGRRLFLTYLGQGIGIQPLESSIRDWENERFRVIEHFFIILQARDLIVVLSSKFTCPVLAVASIWTKN